MERVFLKLVILVITSKNINLDNVLLMGYNVMEIYFHTIVAHF